MPQSLARQTMAAVTWSYTGVAANILLQVAANVTYARLLGPDQFGLFAAGMLVTGILKVISDLEQTPSGAAELQQRTNLFGECKRTEDETSGEFHGRLRHWLDRVIPQTKSPLHAPRQTGD